MVLIVHINDRHAWMSKAKIKNQRIINYFFEMVSILKCLAVSSDT